MFLSSSNNFNRSGGYVDGLWHIVALCVRNFGLVGIYGISTIVGYSVPNPFYTYILNIISKHALKIKNLKQARALFFTQLNSFIYYLIRIIIFTINHLFAESLVFLSIAIYYVTANWLKSQNGTLFSHVWRRGRLALDPLQNKSSFRVFLSGI